ncbi:CCA tRNA nucleotidyltransferase [Chengkuizengella axinellae]|uniref:CCA tRNA nucleotidyltransferase n=1 Tax=Chengkuizengella axinellae TaxID=3064388 RepID=A0ABT9IWT8_9BACL|nr:CCA tRNA nucleotidyltransferase [Chengkuizengella sp. 2205SS18-9]MDP5273834.1 CCA tRNA nucleotidyltransferase [Chengkuizengella sp. 2205SS18-9]
MIDIKLMVKEASEVIHILEKQGYEAYFVGGYVRDKLLNRNIKDIDITTSAYPSNVMDIFTHTVPTGLQHGTVTVVKENYHFEVTTFRTESQYEDFRRPKEVQFVGNLVDDLERRDFTMNAMALDVKGTLIDPFGGKKDLNSNILKCVGDPKLRFSEDALRMMRAIRFAAEYDLQIEKGTWDALVLHRQAIKHVAMERVTAELDKMIDGADPNRGIQLLIDSELMEYTKEHLQIHKRNWSALSNHRGLNIFQYIEDANIRWTLLFMMLKIETDQMKALLKKLKFPNKKNLSIHTIFQARDWLNERTYLEINWKQAVILYGEDTVKNIYTFLESIADDYSLLELLSFKMSKADFEQILQKGLGWLEDIQIKKINELAIKGNDISSLKTEPGPWIRAVLDQLLTEVALNQLANKHEELLNRAIQIVRGMNENE